MFTKEIYEVEGGFGYKILQDETPILDQPFFPGKPGYDVMTEVEANEQADLAIISLESN